MVSPDVNTIFLPIEVEGVQEAHFARGLCRICNSSWLFIHEILIFFIKGSDWHSYNVYNLRNDDFKNI
jgi:hypothetical protein